MILFNKSAFEIDRHVNLFDQLSSRFMVIDDDDMKKKYPNLCVVFTYNPIIWVLFT